MVATEMIKHGYKPGKGLGASLQGITEPITLAASEKFFGVGFHTTKTNVTWENEQKSNEEAFREINRELEQFENKPKPNLNETELVNLGSSKEVQKTMISIHTDERTSDALIQLLFEFKDVFAWSYDDMPGLSVDLVVHKLPTYPDYPPVQQKQRKFKTDISDKIKEEVTKQLKAGVIRVVRYTTCLANMVPVPKKDGKTRVCVDYRDLNKARPKDNSPLPNIHILVDNCSKHEI
ncbi:uncharacterized protein [Nicotiana sylvestris]|uniref:uncharacterized protein n=1 Tax=Nicotiana sylvestris TaxID=4096 RepID=UPI00388C67E6